MKGGRWQVRKAAVILLVAVAAVAAILLAGALRTTLYALLVAGVLAFLLTPLHKRLTRHLPSPAAAACALGVALVPLAAIIAALPLLYGQIQGIGQLLLNGVSQLRTLSDKLLAWLDRTTLPKSFITALQQQLNQLLAGVSAEQAAQQVVQLGRQLPGMVWLITTPVLAYYFLTDRSRMATAVLRLLPPRPRAVVRQIGLDVYEAINSFLRAQLGTAFFVGLATAVLLAVCGIPYAPAWGLLHFLLNFIPYFGAVIGTVPVILVAAPFGVGRVLAVLAVIFIVQQIENTFIAPRLIASHVGIHPAVVIAVLLASGTVLGWWGMLLAMPAVLFVRCVVRQVYCSVVDNGWLRARPAQG